MSAAGKPYFVDMHAILNKDVNQETVKVWAHDGSNGKPTGKYRAPVCESIKNHALIPGADLVSTGVHAGEAQASTGHNIVMKRSGQHESPANRFGRPLAKP